MRFPSSGLHFGPTQNQTLKEGTSHKDQADRAKELKQWVKQQEETLRALYGEEVENSPSSLLLEEMEECFGETDWAAMDYVPDRNRTSPACSSSRRRHRRRKRSTPAAAAPAEPKLPTAASPEQPTPAVAHAELSPLPPAAAEFPAGFSSCPGRRHRRRAVATEKVWVGASNFSMEGPSAMASSRLSSEFVGGHPAPSAGLQSLVRSPVPAWVQASLEAFKRKLMKSRCCKFVLHLMGHPQDLDLVHCVLQAEFLAERWLDGPVPVSAGGPFDPLLIAIKAAQSPKPSEPQPAAAGSTEPQPAAAGSTEPQPATAGSTVPQPAAAGSTEPRHVPEEPVGGLPPFPGPEHLLSFLWGVLTELKPDSEHDFTPPDARTDTTPDDSTLDTLHDTPQSNTPLPDSGPDTPQPDSDTEPDSPQPDSDTEPDSPQPDSDTEPDSPQPDSDTEPDSPQPDSDTDTPQPDSDTDTPQPDSDTDTPLPDSGPPGFFRGRLPDLAPGGSTILLGRPPDLLPGSKSAARSKPPSTSLRGFAWPRRRPPRHLLLRRRPPRRLLLRRRVQSSQVGVFFTIQPFRTHSCLIFSMALAKTEREVPFSLDTYYVSEKLGFVLPDPLENLPSYYQPWMDIALRLPELLHSHELRSHVNKMPLLSTRFLKDHRELRLAHLVLSMITMGYVWQEGENNTVEMLPRNLAVPYWEVSQCLGLPPILTHADAALANWKRKDPEG
ncbi:hypothetical protein ILYODFUR_009071, partial [Ilyodon furcidens]